MLRIEFEDLLRNNERMIGALHFLSYITELAENSATPDLIGMSDLLAVLADASRQQKESLQIILTMTEQRERENNE
ncbi:hypothetical protein [Gallibacterium sp. AGMB14963]|uniref:hypothetical protein n=1 Tax=Gallibacterium faecale TaxID=3019086 RepID=UPI0022F1CBB0|nr:hypothetical protein [Gallibacterium sp. AGMB14963]MDA3977920.1 hypothetical protein [Gallibacterium sp. AGMB14963]